MTQVTGQNTEIKQQGGKRKKRIAEQALKYLRSNFENEDLSLGEVAAHLGISVPYLTVVLRQETNRRFGTHLLELRMEKAKELLCTTFLSVNEIAERVGYSSPAYFATCFKKYTGVSPAVYREKK